MDIEEQGDDPAERAIARDADELEERLERLESHISEAQSKLEEPKRAAGVEEEEPEDEDEDD